MTDDFLPPVGRIERSRASRPVMGRERPQANLVAGDSAGYDPEMLALEDQFEETLSRERARQNGRFSRLRRFAARLLGGKEHGPA